MCGNDMRGNDPESVDARVFRSAAAELMRFAQPLCPFCWASHFAQPLQFGSMSHVLCQPPSLLFLSVIRLVRGSAGAFLPPAMAIEAPLRARASDNAAITILEFMDASSVIVADTSRVRQDGTIKKT